MRGNHTNNKNQCGITHSHSMSVCVIHSQNYWRKISLSDLFFILGIPQFLHLDTSEVTEPLRGCTEIWGFKPNLVRRITCSVSWEPICFWLLLSPLTMHTALCVPRFASIKSMSITQLLKIWVWAWTWFLSGTNLLFLELNWVSTPTESCWSEQSPEWVRHFSE